LGFGILNLEGLIMEKGYGQIIAESFVKALTWGVTLSVISIISLSIMLGMVKQDVKEAIDFTQANAIDNVMDAALGYDVFPKIKQNTKEAIEFAAITMGNEIFSKYYSEKEAPKKK
jgi:Na+-translocating ferredoxin:NAD+ oxidoreductase RnfG subunit